MDINPFINTYADLFVTEIQDLALGRPARICVDPKDIYRFIFPVRWPGHVCELVNPYLGIILPQKTAHQFLYTAKKFPCH